MRVTAQLNNLRLAPRKVRLLAGVLGGLDVARAQFELEHRAKRAAGPLVKLLQSALANAHNNFGLVKENMYIKQILVNEGRKLKRFRPKGFGTVSPIEKKTSHITIILEEKVPGLKAEKKKLTPVEPSEANQAVIPVSGEAEKTKEKKSSFTEKNNRGEGKKKEGGGFKNVKRFFRRKTI